MKLIANASLISLEEVYKYSNELASEVSRIKQIYDSKDYSQPESFVTLPAQGEFKENIYNFLSGKLSEIKYVIVCGIGGANLTAKAVYDAIYGQYEAISPGRFPKIVFADSPDERLINLISGELLTRIDGVEDIFIIGVSKSGKTIETLANFEIIFDLFSSRFGKDKIATRSAIISSKSSPIFAAAQENSIQTFELNEVISDRFGAFSYHGLFPLACVGINIDEFVAGANAALESGFNFDLAANTSLMSACVLYGAYKSNKTIYDSFYFSNYLESLGKWYRQLIAESLGKNGQGFTPVISNGTVDLHSMLQLTLGGPKNKFTDFVYQAQGNDVKVPTDTLLKCSSIISGKSTGQIVEAVFGGVIINYKQNSLGHMETILEGTSLEYKIGEYMQHKMLEVYYLSKLMGVNAFDQPNVEEYKENTRKLISSSS